MATRPSITTALTQQFRDAILRGQFAPSSRLRLEALGESYGVSLSPVREALLRLSAEGFVIGEDQRGFRVAQISVANLAEVTALRAHLEPFALRLSMARDDATWEERLVAMFHRLTRIERQDGYVPFLDEWEQTHREFHLSLVGGCGMPMLVQFCGSLHDLSDRYRRLFLQERAPQRDVAREHLGVMNAVLAKDADTACELLRAHSVRTGEVVRTYMEQRALTNDSATEKIEQTGPNDLLKGDEL